jgi:asparagine synthase (glutamine-hydrolysing)
MCSISGIVCFNGKRVELADLQRFNRSLTHRGPDGEGYYIDETLTIGLAHRRLKILDLSNGGKQPMSYDNGRLHITYNGEIYNFLELRDELKKSGYQFRSESDTEVILASYHQWGTKCLDKFNGMWSFAIWDALEEKLFLARDRFGIKPLHILWTKNGALAFASETLAFKNLEGYRRSFNDLHLASVLDNSFSLEGYGKTIFQDIEQLPAGHCCLFRKGDKELQFTRWWNTLKSQVAIPEGLEAQTKYFKELFFDSCKLRLRSDVPIATALSGGLDSSSVYSTIKFLAQQGMSTDRIPNDWQTAFVATFPGAENDEREFAEQVIQGVNGSAFFSTPDDTDVVRNIISTTQLFDSVYFSPLSVAVDIYKAMSKNGYRVSLDGHGVDEMLLGYPHMLTAAYYSLWRDKRDFLADDVKAAYEGLFPAHVVPPALTRPVEPDASFSGGVKSRLKAYLPEFVLTTYHAVKKKVVRQPLASTGSWVNYKHDIMDEEKFYPGISRLSHTDRNVFREFHLTTLPAILRNFDRASMQNGVEVRMPFMDWRLVSYIFALPFTSKVGDGYTKLILRHAMKGIVPDAIRLRKTKIGFNAPMPQWFSGQLKSFIHDEVNSLSFSNRDVWDAHKIKQFVDEKSKNGWTWGDCHQLWPYLNAHLIAK